MNKAIKSILGILAGSLLMNMVAFADGSMTILETYTGDDFVSVYVKGAESDTSEINVQIATSETENVAVQPICQLDTSMKTLVMIDNSLSIPADTRERIAEFLQNLISDRLNNEEISITTFSEEVCTLTDYTNDYGTLKKAVDSITYQDQETYLTDVLYDLISEKYIENEEDVFYRIIVVSDGVDNKSLGYTKDELYSLLKDIQIPVYTIGCQNSKKNNNEELENMFALSRMTGVDSFLLDETDELLSITDTLNQDRNIKKITIKPNEEMLDGSRKAVKIIFQDGTVLSTEILMPQQISSGQPKEMPATEEKQEPEEKPEIQVEKTKEFNWTGMIILIVAGVIVAVIVVVVMFVLKRKKGQKVDFETIDDSILNELSHIGEREEKTEMISPYHQREDDGETVMIWNNNPTYQIVLTDIHSPARSFQVPLESVVVIGRKKEVCDIVLDYEKSVSGKHCEIRVKDGRFFVKDLQSSNGTWLNESKVLTESEIFSGNILKLGRLEMRFEVR